MHNDLQKASIWKRVAAGIFDFILITVLATGCAWLLSSVLNYDSYDATLQQAYDRYETEYQTTFNITQQTYDAFSPAEKEAYDTAYAALIADEAAMDAYNMVINLMLIITTGSILLAMLLLEFVLPLFLGNGQTLGKKIFGICLMRTDGVRMNNLQLFTRTILGKFTVETMIPVYMIFMLFWNMLDLFGVILVTVLLIAQCVSILVTRTNSLLHDLMAGTVAVDISSQMIFRSTEELVAYQKEIAAERAKRQSY